MVDNKLGPDCLAGHKALDPNYCKQPILWLHDLCLEVLTVLQINYRKASLLIATPFKLEWILINNDTL